MSEFIREDLPECFQTMADSIGMENTNILLEKFGGTEIYFPKNHVKRASAKRYIKANFKAESISVLARKTRMSRSTIFNYLNSM